MFVTLITDIIIVLHRYCGYADCQYLYHIVWHLYIVTSYSSVQLPLLVACYYDILSDCHRSAMFSIIHSYALHR